MPGKQLGHHKVKSVPTISNVAASDITSSSATITWTTNVAAESLVEYGTTTSYGSTAYTAGVYVTSHSMPVSSLPSSTLIHFRVGGKSVAGSLSVSGDYSFTTSGTSPGMFNAAFHAFTPAITTVGPALQSLSVFDFMAEGPGGVFYIVRGSSGNESSYPAVYVLDTGLITTLCSCGRKGDRPSGATPCIAGIALFEPYGGSYPGSMDIACDKSTGDIYLADGWNGKIRRIYSSAGTWMVTTFADGSSGAGDLTGVMNVTVDPSGNVWTSLPNKLIKITSAGSASVIATGTNWANIVDLDCDASGNIYGFNRSPYNQIVKCTPGGTQSILAGGGAGWDGAAADAQFNQHVYVAVADVDLVYTGGGDENNIRRLKAGRVSTLKSDLTWAELGAHDEAYALGGPRIVDSSGYLYVASGLYCNHGLQRFIPAA